MSSARKRQLPPSLPFGGVMGWPPARFEVIDLQAWAFVNPLVRASLFGLDCGHTAAITGRLVQSIGCVFPSPMVNASALSPVLGTWVWESGPSDGPSLPV